MVCIQKVKNTNVVIYNEDGCGGSWCNPGDGCEGHGDNSIDIYRHKYE